MTEKKLRTVNQHCNIRMITVKTDFFFVLPKICSFVAASEFFSYYDESENCERKKE